MTDDEIVTALKSLISSSEGQDIEYRKQALDYYYMRSPAHPGEGHSGVVSGDLSAMTEAQLSQMLDAFTTDNAIEFEPSGKDDEKQAELESDVVSYVVMEANDGYNLFAEAIKDALLLRNGITKTWVDEDQTVEEATFENVTPESFAELTQGDDSTEVEVLELEDTHLKVRAVRTVRNLVVEAIPPENFILTKNWNSLDLHNVPFCAEIKKETRSSLIEQGFDKATVKDLPADSSQNMQEGARNPKSDTTASTVPDESQEIIEVHECYVLMDLDGDGISERRRMILAGTELLANDVVTIVPYASGSVFIAPHRFRGISLFDKIKQSQDTRTALNRALLDNANATNKSRIGYNKNGNVDLDSLESGGVSALIGCDNPATDIVPLTVADISAGILANLQEVKAARNELGGAALELASGQAQLGSNQVGSEGLDRAYSVMEQLAAHMARNIAETLVKNTFLIAHATLREHFDKPINIRVGGRWNTAVPSEWPERKRINVKIGMSAGERNRKISALAEIRGQQQNIASQGGDGVLVDIEGSYNALIDWARAAEIDNPQRYWIDPTTEESQKALQEKVQAQEQERKEAKALMSTAVGIEQLKIAFDKYKQDTTLKLDYFKEEIKAEIEESKLTGKATKDLMDAQDHARAKAGAPKAGPSADEKQAGDSLL